MRRTITKHETCSTCLYWNGPTLECRYYPPPPKIYDANLKTFKKQHSPTTDSDYWCGQHSFFSDAIVGGAMVGEISGRRIEDV